VTDARPRPAFAHASEAELARILDFYEVAWEYEPHTFPILFDREGAVLESFSPDFYLPELDLYVEITTLKLRRLRELYPALRVKLLYARDFRALLLKYGRIALADALSGAEGQATPPRREAVAPAGPAVMPASVPVVARRAAGHDHAPSPSRSRRARRTRAEARARAAARAAAGTETTA
jgi:hypothetical protein